MMDLLRDRGFALLWSGQFLGTLADWALRTLVLIWVYGVTRSGVAVSLVGLAEALPLLALAPLAGVLSTAGAAPAPWPSWCSLAPRSCSRCWR